MATSHQLRSPEGEVLLNYLKFATPELVEDYSDAPVPLLLALHGVGRRGPVDGSDLASVSGLGALHVALDSPRGPGLPRVPFLVVAPQCPSTTRWSALTVELKMLLDEVVADESPTIDMERVYITGLSMGAKGTWAMLCAYPTLFAAAAPVCGSFNHPLHLSEAEKAEYAAIQTGRLVSAEDEANGRISKVPASMSPNLEAAVSQQDAMPDVATLARIKHVPVWIFHGVKDPVVPVTGSTSIHKALVDAGALHAKLSVYPQLDVDVSQCHDSWTCTYENPELYSWLLSHRNSHARARIRAAARALAAVDGIASGATCLTP